MAVILLADDDAMVRETIAMLLEDAGHEVHQASDGAGALEMLETMRPDLVVTDVFMPQIDGIELIRSIRRIHADLKVLAISGGGMYQDPKLATQLAAATGASRVLRKPVSNDELLDEVALLVSPESA